MADHANSTPALFSGSAPLTMSSREISDLTGKRHDNVMADIRRMLEELGKAAPEFLGTALIDGPNGSKRQIDVFNLSKRETLILVSGYSVELRARIIDRWQELESGATPRAKRHNLTSPEERAFKLIPMVTRAARVAPRTGAWIETYFKG